MGNIPLGSPGGTNESSRLFSGVRHRLDTEGLGQSGVCIVWNISGTHIIQTNRAPFIAIRRGPFTVLSRWKTSDDMARSIPLFHFAQGRSEVC